MRQTLAIGAFIIFLCTTAQAGPKKIAVLELRNSAGLKDQEVAYITDMVRRQALGLPQDRYVVMTKENILEMLPPGTDLNKCEGQCEVETGRNVGADYVVSGEVIKFGKNLKVNMKMHDTKTSVLISSDVASAPTIDGLEEPVGKAALHIFMKVPGAAGFFSGPSGGKITMAEFGLLDNDIGKNIVNPVVDQSGYLFVDSKPQGATVVINGEEKGQTPYQAELMVGDYVVVCARGSLYFPAKQQIKMTTKKIKLNMELEPNFGILKVTSGPAGAAIEINGEPTGQRTPFTFKEKPSGKYIVKLTKDLYLSKMQEVTVTPKKEAILDFPLEPNFGSLSVESDPKGMPIKLDGKPTGKVTPASFSSLSAGLHEVEVGSAQYVGEAKRVDIKRGQNAAVSIPLTGRYGLLKITAVVVDEDKGTPTDATVWLDGAKQESETPFKEQFLVGSYSVKIEANEARPYVTMVQIQEGKTTQIEAKLDKLLSAEIMQLRAEKKRHEQEKRDAIWEEKADKVRPSRFKFITTGVLLIVGGAAASGTGIYLASTVKTAISDRNKAYSNWLDASSEADARKYQSMVQDKDKTAKTYNWLGWACLGTGVGLATAGVVTLFFTPPLPEREVFLVSDSLSLKPWLSPEGNGLVLDYAW